MAERLARLGNLTDSETIALIANDFGLFVQAMFDELGQPLVWHPYLDLICAKLDDLAHGRIRNLAICMPPRHLKSSCVSVALPAYVLGHNPKEEVMCVSYAIELSRGFAMQTQRMMQTPLYRQLFGDILGGQRQAPHQLRTLAGGIRRATSIDGVATGVGADLMIFDDPQKAGEVLSETVRTSTNQAYQNTFLSRRNMPMQTRMALVMQRLHEDDFFAHVLQNSPHWEVLNLPAIAEEDQEIGYETFLGPQVYRRRVGGALHPTRVPLKELARIRQMALSD